MKKKFGLLEFIISIVLLFTLSVVTWYGVNLIFGAIIGTMMHLVFTAIPVLIIVGIVILLFRKITGK